MKGQVDGGAVKVDEGVVEGRGSRRWVKGLTVFVPSLGIFHLNELEFKVSLERVMGTIVPFYCCIAVWLPTFVV